MDQQHPYVQQQLQLAAERRANVNKEPMQHVHPKIKAHFAFGLATGIMPDLGPDSEAEDFVVDVKFKVRVVWVDGDLPLSIPVDQCMADIFVLYDCDEEWPVPRPVGWIWGPRLKKMANQEGICECPASKLLPFEAFVKMMRRHKLNQ